MPKGVGIFCLHIFTSSHLQTPTLIPRGFCALHLEKKYHYHISIKVSVRCTSYLVYNLNPQILISPYPHILSFSNPHIFKSPSRIRGTAASRQHPHILKSSYPHILKLIPRGFGALHLEENTIITFL
jgi:hypothetical protein